VIETRSAWVAENERLEEVRGYDFEKLRCGNEVQGPAIIWTPITTVVVNPSQLVKVDAHRNLVIWDAESDEPASAVLAAATDAATQGEDR
jgi:N-methylhydantoinase A/oxoprolinase/acetone carboxylase beta subunit